MKHHLFVSTPWICSILHEGDTLANSRSVWFPVEQLNALVSKLETEEANGLHCF